MGSPATSIHARLQQQALRECVPLHVTLELTLACNLRCVHCYNFDRSVPAPKARGAELDPAEVTRVLGEIRDAGCLYVAFTGGEALLHPHLLDFVRLACDSDMIVRVKSNATLLTRARADALVAAGAVAVDVSLYGAEPSTHDAFTVSPGSFARTVAGIDAARAAGLAVRIAFCLTRHNAGEVEAMIALAGTLGVPFSFDPQLTARYDGTRSSLDHRVDRPTLEALYGGSLAHLLPSPDCHAEGSVQCACARSVCGISSSGDVYPCIGAPMPCGNLRDASFEAIWRDSPPLNAIRALTLPDFRACAPCPDRAFCRRSSGVVFVNTGDYTGPEPWTCMEASVLHQLHAKRTR